MDLKSLNLKALEVFLAVSRRGVLGDAARDLGISISTASHHLKELEKAVGTPLFEPTRRPKQLTAAGTILQRQAQEALGALQNGLNDIWAGAPQSLVRRLRLAVIEDFDADVAPALTQDLLRAAPTCALSLLSRPTHDILGLLDSQQVDLGVAASADFGSSNLHEVPLVRDPFILLLPAGHARAPASLADLAAQSANLPLLRYSSHQLLGQRIEAQLRRLNVAFPRRMEFETTHVILSLVAAGHGWTLTTALSFARAQRYHSQLRVLPVPGRAFSREISLFARDDIPDLLTKQAERSLRQSILRMVIDPTVMRYPWLASQFRLIDESRDGCATESEIGP